MFSNDTERIQNESLRTKITSAEKAARMIQDGMTIGISGFTSSGYPKSVPTALAEQVKAGRAIQIDLYTGASVGPEVDTALTEAGIIKRRLPYHTNRLIRERINDGTIEYVDMHLSHSPQYVNYHFLKKVDIAIVEALAITEEGHLIPTTSVGNTPTFVRQSDKVIVEINGSFPMEMAGMADILIPENPPARKPLPICHPADRAGTPYIECGPEKIAAIVFTNENDKTRPFKKPDEISERISQHILNFFAEEVKHGRLTNSLLPLQSGVGSVANAVLYGLCDSAFENLTCYTEVVQDSMLELLRTGKASVASTTAVSPSPERLKEFLQNIAFYKEKIVLRPQEISNSPEVVRRLGVIAMNTAIEIDLYGNVNSTHIMGSKIMNGIGGSGDFARNAAITIFSTPSTAKGGAISSIVPMVCHVDHTEHDVMVVVTEQGYADLRGRSPKERAEAIIQNCAHPDYKEALWDYFKKACAESHQHTPHTLRDCLSWHMNYLEHGTMKK